MIPETGTPRAEGRYVAFLRCEAQSAAAWVEPVIMTWASGKWHSSFVPQRRVLGWIGPLPVMKADDLPQGYDL